MKKNNKYRLVLVLFLMMLTVICCGCSNRKDIEDSSYILAMGFEKINEKYLVRYSYADFDNEKANSGTKVPSKSITFLASSWKDANKKWEKYQMKKLNFGHLKVVVFGKNSRNKEIIHELLDHPQIAKSVFVLDSKNTIDHVFSKEKDLPISLGEYMAKSIENSDKIKTPKNYTLGRILY